MSVSNLTNTKWVLNSSLNISDDILAGLNFISNETEYTEFYIHIVSHSDLEYGSDRVYRDGTWTNEAYRIIEITGGTDVTNASLISWLEANATQVEVTSLADTKWVFGNTVKWWSDTSLINKYYSVNFTTNSQNCSRLVFENANADDVDFNLSYYPISNYTNPQFRGGYASPIVLTFVSGMDNAYKTIEFTDGTDIANPDLIAWLSQNATYQSQPVTPVTPAKTFDLSTLGLSSGTHTIQVKARATGYTDSEFSNSVSYSVSNSHTTISWNMDTTGHGSAGDAYYSVDNGTTWTQITTDTGSITLTTSQIKFKFVVYGGVSDWEQSLYKDGTLVMSPDVGTWYSENYSTVGNPSFTIESDAGCFAENTQIKLSNGLTKSVQDISYEDELLVYDLYNGKISSAKPIWIMKEKIAKSYKKVTLSNGIILKLIGSGQKCHRLFNVTKQKFLYANECVGDEVYTLKGIATVLSCEIIHEKVKYYNLNTNKYLNCFADEVLAGSRLNNMYHISNMKYDSTERLISKEEEAKRWKIREALRK